MKKRYLAVIILVILLDQFTKFLARTNLNFNDSITLIPKVLGLTYVENRGAAFSMLSGSPILLKIMSVIILLGLIYLLYFNKLSIKVNIAYSMLIGGAIGNIIDRFLNGYVIDFLEFKFIQFPVFNISDIFVTSAVALLIAIQIIFKEDII